MRLPSSQQDDSSDSEDSDDEASWPWGAFDDDVPSRFNLPTDTSSREFHTSSWASALAPAAVDTGDNTDSLPEVCVRLSPACERHDAEPQLPEESSSFCRALTCAHICRHPPCQH